MYAWKSYNYIGVSVCGSLWLQLVAKLGMLGCMHVCGLKKSTVYTRQKSHLHACEAIAAQNVPKAFNVSIISWVSSYILLNPYIASLNISILSIEIARRFCSSNMT